MAAKVFEVNDVLPATTQLRISWDTSDVIEFLYFNEYYGDNIKSDNDNFVFLTVYNDSPLKVYNLLGYEVAGHWIGDVEDSPQWLGVFVAQQYLIVDTSSWSLEKRTISTYGDFSPNISFYWEDVAPSGYTITFNSNGGTTFTDIEDATELPTLPTPTKSGYTFVNWYYDSSFTQKAIAGDTIESNVTLYAKWHNLGSLFTEIANAIRSKDGTSENIRDVDFGERVKQIQGAIELTQAQYDALGTKDANTYYLIVEVE